MNTIARLCLFSVILFKMLNLDAGVLLLCVTKINKLKAPTNFK